jgi:glucose/arabinose dehydrogenase
MRRAAMWLCLYLAISPGAAGAATVPAGFADSVYAGGLTAPTAMAFAPDGRLFVCLQGGQVRVIQNGSLLPTPFLSLSVDSRGERGLLGIAFDPNFDVNHHVYVYYTVPGTPPHNRVSRFTANGNTAPPGSEVAILELESLSLAQNHNGGAIHFGPDGKLYVAVGENANGANSQTLSNRLGKILRINPDGSIPGDNPFVGIAPGVNQSIWAIGLRNPFTFAFHPATGRMFINDVGSVLFEEINDGAAGANYGWPQTEGPTQNPAFVSPLYAYGHGAGPMTGCAITGGAFYVPPTPNFPAHYLEQYFFADVCSGWINRVNPSTGVATTFAAAIDGPVDLHVGPDGALYYLARSTGANGFVGRITSTVSASQPVGHVDLPSGPAASQPFSIAGWAADLGAASGTGVNQIHVWAYPNPGSGAPPVFVGQATYGMARPDVGAAFGSRFTNSGYSFQVRGLMPDSYLFVVYALSVVTGAYTAETLLLSVGAQPNLFIDAPTSNASVGQPFLVAGWAADFAAASGTGMAAVHVWAIADANGAASFLGSTALGFDRPDVAAFSGAQFRPSGWALTATGLPPGGYQIVAYGFSSVSNAFTVAKVVHVSVR